MKRHVLCLGRLAFRSARSSQYMRAMGSKARVPILLPEDQLVDEEKFPAYRPERFLQVHPGDVLDGKYEVLTKLGFGQNSTVWLAKDRSRWFWQKPMYSTIKVQTAQPHPEAAEAREDEIQQRLTKSPEHHGYGFVRRATRRFTSESSAGQKHICQVFEPMREPIINWQDRLPDGKIPGPLLKVYIRFILHGLDYLHTQCRIVHTDLSRYNIMMSFEDDSVLPGFVKSLGSSSLAHKVTRDRTVYESQFDFGPPKSIYSIPQIHDWCNAALMMRGFGCQHPIQPDIYRAPEVMLGTGWSYEVDIWNLGVLMFELLEGVDLFEHVGDERGKYSTRAHLANMIALLGPPPSSLIKRERASREMLLPYAVTDDEGKTHSTMAGLYQGPFFLEDGSFAFAEMVPRDLSLEGRITALDGNDKLAFIDFAKQMLCWHFQDRKTAGELLTHPWLVNEPEQ